MVKMTHVSVDNHHHRREQREPLTPQSLGNNASVHLAVRLKTSLATGTKLAGKLIEVKQQLREERTRNDELQAENAVLRTEIDAMREAFDEAMGLAGNELTVLANGLQSKLGASNNPHNEIENPSPIVSFGLEVPAPPAENAVDEAKITASSTRRRRGKKSRVRLAIETEMRLRRQLRGPEPTKSDEWKKTATGYRPEAGGKRTLAQLLKPKFREKEMENPPTTK